MEPVPSRGRWPAATSASSEQKLAPAAVPHTPQGQANWQQRSGPSSGCGPSRPDPGSSGQTLKQQLLPLS